MPKDPFRTRIARAGLDSLMRDPRYWDGTHPQHGALVDMVQRGFQIVFDGPDDRARRNPARIGPPPRPGLLDSVLTDTMETRERFEAAPSAERERQGRRVMLSALRADNFPLPPGLESEDDNLGTPAPKPPAPQPRREQNNEDGLLAQNRPGAPFPHPTPPRRPQSLSSPPAAPATPTGQAQPSDPWPASPVSNRFREEIHNRESQVNNYRAVNGDAWGRYQLTGIARQQIGLQRADGSFTGKYGVNSRDEFLKNRKAQEQAFADYMADNLQQLRAKGATNRIGQRIAGIRSNFTVTENGLLAAAAREGAGATNLYLKHLERHGWKSDASTFPSSPPPLRDSFLAIETRLREFENIRHHK